MAPVSLVILVLGDTRGLLGAHCAFPLVTFSEVPHAPQAREQVQVGRSFQAPGWSHQVDQPQGRPHAGWHSALTRRQVVACYRPLKAYRTPSGVVFNQLGRFDIIGDLELPCGQCIGCRQRRASEWALRVMHEASCWDNNCFVTLTYGRDQLPPEGSLCHRDFQLFMKRVRKHAGSPVRFYMCGEYGPLNLRPHYHACLFNINFSDRIPAGKSGAGAVFFKSATLDSLWTHGLCSVQDLCKETAGYAARYILKKMLGRESAMHYCYADDDGVIHRRAAEYAAMSLKPGIGAEWFNKFSRDVYPHDFVVADGSKNKVPRYYDLLLKRVSRETLEDVQWSRVLKARDVREDSTDARLAVREVVHEARVKSLKERNSV